MDPEIIYCSVCERIEVKEDWDFCSEQCARLVK